MGIHPTFATFARIVIEAYDQDKLDLDLLDRIAEVYRDADIDMNGARNRKAKDGKSIIEVVVKIVAPDWKPTKANLSSFEQKQKNWEGCSLFHKWNDILLNRWGWW